MILCDTDGCVCIAAGATGRKNKVLWCTRHDPRPRPTYVNWREADCEDRRRYGVCGVINSIDPPGLCDSPVTWVVMGVAKGERSPYHFCDFHAEIEKEITNTA